MEPENYIGILTIFLDRKEVCIGWAKNLEELKTVEDECFSVAEPDADAWWKLDMLLRKATIQAVALNNNTIKIFLTDVF
jgi:hypothetical protein